MTTEIKLSGVKETLLFTLYAKAIDYRAKTSLLNDRLADEVFTKVSRTSLKMRLNSADRYLPVLRAKRMDEWTLDFLARHPDATVLQLACGLDSRAFRLDLPEGVRWYDVDFPDVAALREGLFPSRENYHLIGSSVTDDGWLDEVPADRPVLVIAEGLFMYLTENDVRQLLQHLTGRFPEGELVFDVMSKPIARFSSLFGFKLWGLDDPHELERWHLGLTLLDDVPAISDYARIPSPPFRAYSALVNRIPGVRTMLRPLRYRFTRAFA